MTVAVVHIGLPKAGSSSIQASFSLSRRRLEQAGWRLAHFTRLGRTLSAHAPAFRNLYADDPGAFRGNLRAGVDAKDERARFRAEMDANLRSGKPLIFTGEGISALSRSEATRMRDDFAAHGYTLRLFGFVRAPTAYLTGLSQQAIRGGATDPVPRGQLADFLSHRVANIRAVFPDAAFLPFAAALDHPGGPPGCLADWIEPGLSAHLQITRRNPSISDNAAALILHINRLVPVYLDREARRTSPLRMPRDVAALYRLPGRPFYLRASDLRETRPQIEAENRWLADNLGPEFCDPPNAEPDDAPVEWTEAQAQALARVLPRLQKHLRIAAANHFADRADVPDALRSLPARHRMGGNWFLRYVRGGPGVGTLEKAYRKLRRQW